MVNDAWAAAYRAWSQFYDNPTDVARAVVREMITRALEADKTQDIGYDPQEGSP